MIRSSNDPEAPPIPKIPNINRALWDIVTKDENKLDMSIFNESETTHGRSGWVIHLAGKAGYAIENYLGSTALAALLIYNESGYPISCLSFFEKNNDAMKSIKSAAIAEEVIDRLGTPEKE